MSVKVRSTGQDLPEPAETVTDEQIRALRMNTPHSRAMAEISKRREEEVETPPSALDRAAKHMDARFPRIKQYPDLMAKAVDGYQAIVQKALREGNLPNWDADFDKLGRSIYESAGFMAPEEEERKASLSDMKKARGQE